jgi:putative ABC transport system permease protein
MNTGKWLKLAARNVLRNKRRSLATLLAIGVGFAAITLFYGYMSNVYSGLRISAIQGEGLGHLTIYKSGWLEKGKIDPERYMFAPEEITRMSALIKSERDVVLATPQLQIGGLVSNGDVSTIFMAQGVVPKDERIIKGQWAAYRPVNGEGLLDDKPYGVEVAQDLARYLNLQAGKDGVLMASTLSGQMNAMDMQVAGVFDSGSDATNDKYMRVTFEMAQSLYDTKSADKIVVLLDDWKKTESMRAVLRAKLSNAGIPCDMRTWNELSLFYSKVRQMFDMIFLFIFCIVLVIVVMSVINTMGMAVLERTREIGTLRALGLKQRGVSFLFAIEGGLLGLLGSLVGAVLHVIVWTIIKTHPITYTPPNISSPVQLTVGLVPGALVFMLMCMVVLSLGAAIVPARHAAKQNVVAALGHA